MNRNYAKELDQILAREENKGKHLFLHSCCAPCSSYVLEYLRPFFRITVFYYNPNITMEEEYQKRVAEQKRLIAEFNRQLRSGGGDGCLSH
ncbi:epoxyqueuosine reductase QueH [Muribaculaceae bacterium]|nr:epoxyqueuosine reductase QueH [Muribaculaceae bacterium]